MVREVSSTNGTGMMIDLYSTFAAGFLTRARFSIRRIMRDRIFTYLHKVYT
jgi:hypothetical protein